MIKALLEYVEIKTKVTSLITFIMAIAYMKVSGYQIQFLPTLIFFLGMFVFDLTTTSINNYIDTKTNGESLGFSRKTALMITLGLLTLSTVLGVYLVYLTDIVVLLLGMFSFAVGIFYTFGPIPISRQPYGEIISGVLFGYVIPFILIHANDPHTLVYFAYHQGMVNVEFNILNILKFLLVFLVPTLLTSSIMLANNTCDLEVDVKVNRYTLPFYLGVDHSVKLMYCFFFSIYGSIVLAVILKVLPWTALLSLITFIPAYKNVKSYAEKLIKDESDIFIIKNFMLVLVPHALFIYLGSFL